MRKSGPQGLGDSAKFLKVFGLPLSSCLVLDLLNIRNPSIDSDISEADVTKIVIASDTCRPE